MLSAFSAIWLPFNRRRCMMSLVSMCSRLSSRWTTCSWGAKRGMRQATLERYVSREAKKITLNRLLKMGRELTPAALLENGRYVHEVVLKRNFPTLNFLFLFSVSSRLKRCFPRLYGLRVLVPLLLLCAFSPNLLHDCRSYQSV